ncbi:hypothetical protein J6590_097060 [Homalodisca vitripennis]|nr:hypothetical protein J6590_097060 [Homalodisca vitripennis]
MPKAIYSDRCTYSPIWCPSVIGGHIAWFCPPSRHRTFARTFHCVVGAVLETWSGRVYHTHMNAHQFSCTRASRHGSRPPVPVLETFSGCGRSSLCCRGSGSVATSLYVLFVRIYFILSRCFRRSRHGPTGCSSLFLVMALLFIVPSPIPVKIRSERCLFFRGSHCSPGGTDRAGSAISFG